MGKLFQQQARSLALTIRTSRLLNTFHFYDAEILEQPLGDDKAEVDIKAIGVNFKDVMIALR